MLLNSVAQSLWGVINYEDDTGRERSILDISIHAWNISRRWYMESLGLSNGLRIKRRDWIMTTLVSQEPGLATIPESPTGENHALPRQPSAAAAAA